MIRCRLCKIKKAYFKYKVGLFFYYFCTSCQTLFLNPSLSKHEVDNYYKNNFNYSSAQENKERTKQQAKKIIDKLRRFNKYGKSLLDIGAGYGYFIEEAEKVGLTSIGIDPAKKILKVKNKKILTVTFDSYIKKNTRCKFDFITLIHVIEHLTDAKTTVNEALSMLKPNGILYIETPNLDSYLYNQEKNNYTFLTPPDHQWIFSKKSIFKILKKNLAIDISTYSYPEHFVKIIKSCFFSKTTSTHATELPKNNQPSLLKKIKYVFFDQIIAPLFVWTLNLFNKGTFLQVYIKKV